MQSVSHVDIGGGPSSTCETGLFLTPKNDEFYSKRIYRQLQPSEREIRLLVVHPERLAAQDIGRVFPDWVTEGSTDAAKIGQGQSCGDGTFICCRLREPVKLADVWRKYSSLSYSAGKATETKPIMVDGYWFRAFANLEYALERFRSVLARDSAISNLLWTDQICINQTNLVEKPHQVGFMRNIYQKSNRTYVLLSNDNAPIENAQAGADAVRLVSKHMTDWARRELTCYVIRQGMDDGFSSFFQEIFQQPSHPICDVLDPLLSFLGRVAVAPWWTRAWVFQEFIVSHDVYFLCDYQCLSAHQLIPCLQYLHWNFLNHHHALATDPKHIISRLLKDSAIRAAQSTEQYKLLLLFVRTRRNAHLNDMPGYGDGYTLSMLHEVATHEFHATDPRDLIYAFIGLSKYTANIMPNYADCHSMWDAFIQVAESFLEEGADLKLLRFTAFTRGWSESGLRVTSLAIRQSDACDELAQPAKTASLLPSWAPDWSSKNLVFPSQQQPYAFAGGFRHKLISDPKRSKWKILRVRGTKVGCIHLDEYKYLENIIGSQPNTAATERGQFEIWAIHGGSGFFVLQGRGGTEYVLAGVDDSFPDKGITWDLDGAVGKFRISPEVVTARNTEWIDIF